MLDFGASVVLIASGWVGELASIVVVFRSGVEALERVVDDALGGLLALLGGHC